MKIRAVTIGIHISSEDVLDLSKFQEKVEQAYRNAKKIASALEVEGYSVQTLRLALNPFEQWLLPACKEGFQSLVDIVRSIDSILAMLGVEFCSFGPAATLEGLKCITDILCNSRASCSVSLGSPDTITADRRLCEETAALCLEIARKVGDLGNFRFCAAFRCPPNIPFFPVAYHQGDESVATIGLENGDMIFLGCFAANDHTDARNILTDLLRQAYEPIQSIVEQVCAESNIIYGGIDASFNPGLLLPDSIGKGLEDLIGTEFGRPGTLAGVATLTASIKALPSTLKICGYSGLMLPVMEDLILSQRATENLFKLQDLLFFSAVCGVGLDTVPIPIASDPNTLANIYLDMAAMAFRLNKPLTCRLLPMELNAGDITQVSSPYLCNTKVFSLN